MLWLLALPVVLSTRISWEENKVVKENCGARFIGEPSPPVPDGTPKFLVMGGKPAAINEFPFAVALAVREKRFAGRFSNCTGVQISPRHIMTAAHCVVSYDQYQLGWRCRIRSSESVPMSKVEPELIMAHVGTTCPPSGSCYPRGTEYKASAVR
ncbi:hypothetical protein ANCCAN_21658 [Ancylostoma caninum]|uniref:Peptidase S1 domain-containing protein n=1 Tax=Ancylostoma caninum TaxID=29170 RepID=A0A368FLW0_ANCCA|nr:hypothetical protein ANCCAN_21658 [Ancylostoma caninum]